ncbi:MAG: hypothetical protein FWF20_12530 [Betaproteobacteria bacterium]|nr:hypothetical protein [Betaproteobacteria bacterium]MCL2887571.1 hypothetical protein [Betaproteobacteria bacterium]
MMELLRYQRKNGQAPHHAAEVAELRADRDLASEYLKAAMESLDDPDNRAAGLVALRTVAEAYGGLGAIALDAGIMTLRALRLGSPHLPGEGCVSARRGDRRAAVE